MAIQVDPHHLMDDGYIIVREVIPPSRLDALRGLYEVLVERQKAIWARDHKPDDPPGGAWETSAQPRLWINNVVDEATAETMGFLLNEPLGVSQQVLKEKDVILHAMFFMCSPVRDHGPAAWHRDTSPEWDPPLQGIEQDMMANGPGYVQWNIPLYDDSVFWVVPGSHRRANTEAEQRQLQENPRMPLPGGIPVELKAGDGVVYTNFLLHWGSNYSPRLRRTIHVGYQSSGGPLFRYFHLWWNPDFTTRLPSAMRAMFDRWTGCLIQERAQIERIFRAMLARDAAAFRAGLAGLHPGEQGRMVCVVQLCKLAKKLHEVTRPETLHLPLEKRPGGIFGDAVWYEALLRRMTPEEYDLLWRRFAALDARLRADGEENIAGTQARSAQYRVYEMPANVDVETFIASWDDRG